MMYTKEQEASVLKGKDRIFPDKATQEGKTGLGSSSCHLVGRKMEKISVLRRKKFNLDGPDGFAYYWHHVHTNERMFYKLQGGGGGVMVWACFSYYVMCGIVFLEGQRESKKYCETLAQYFLPFAAVTHEESWLF